MLKLQKSILRLLCCMNLIRLHTFRWLNRKKGFAGVKYFLCLELIARFKFWQFVGFRCYCYAKCQQYAYFYIDISSVYELCCNDMRSVKSFMSCHWHLLKNFFWWLLIGSQFANYEYSAAVCWILLSRKSALIWLIW